MQNEDSSFCNLHFSFCIFQSLCLSFLRVLCVLRGKSLPWLNLWANNIMDMDKLVALCRRRGFLFQSSEIYGGLNGFWDYGPLGVELKRNIKEAWWRDMVTAHNELLKPPGAPSAYEMVGLDSAIIMHPQVWKCSGHYDLFH